MLDVLLGGNAALFGVPALLGTLFFVGRLVLMFVAGDGDLHQDVGLHIDTGTGDVAGHTDSSSAFKILSLQAIAAFLMGFGWGGLGIVRGWGWPVLAGVAAGIVTGGAMAWVLGKLLLWISRMQSSGTQPMEAALYEEGVVYVKVPERRLGRGVVRVVVDERLQYYPAVTDGPALDSQAAVRITAVNDDHTLTVEPVTPELPASGG
jgi:hypothetical protein